MEEVLFGLWFQRCWPILMGRKGEWGHMLAKKDIEAQQNHKRKRPNPSPTLPAWGPGTRQFGSDLFFQTGSTFHHSISLSYATQIWINQVWIQPSLYQKLWWPNGVSKCHCRHNQSSISLISYVDFNLIKLLRFNLHKKYQKWLA